MAERRTDGPKPGWLTETRKRNTSNGSSLSLGLSLSGYSLWIFQELFFLFFFFNYVFIHKRGDICIWRRLIFSSRFFFFIFPRFCGLRNPTDSIYTWGNRNRRRRCCCSFRCCSFNFFKVFVVVVVITFGLSWHRLKMKQTRPVAGLTNALTWPLFPLQQRGSDKRATRAIERADGPTV